MLRWWVLGCLLLSCVACDAVLGLGQFTFDGGSSDATDECTGPNGCYACTPTTNDQFLNSCSNTPCVGFDSTRIDPFLVDGALPPLPPIEAGVAESGPSDASSDDGGG